MGPMQSNRDFGLPMYMSGEKILMQRIIGLWEGWGLNMAPRYAWVTQNVFENELSIQSVSV